MPQLHSRDWTPVVAHGHHTLMDVLSDECLLATISVHEIHAPEFGRTQRTQMGYRHQLRD